MRAVLGAWPLPIVVIPLAIAGYLLLPSGPPADSGALIVETAQMRPAVLNIAAATDTARVTGNVDSLEAAIAVLDGRRASVSDRAAAILGPEVAQTLLGRLDESLAEFTRAARVYGGGGGDSGAGRDAFTETSLALDRLLRDLGADLDGQIEALGVASSRALELVLLAIVAAAVMIIFRAVRFARAAVAQSARSATLTTVHRDLPVTLFIAGASGRIEYASAASALLLGYPPSELVGQSLRDLLPEADLEPLSDPDGGGVVRFDADWTHPDGSKRRVSVLAHVTRAGDGSPLTTVGIIRDRHDEIVSEDALRESEERFRTVLDNTQNGIMVISTTGRLLLHNRALTALLGYSEEEMSDLALGDIVPPDHVDKAMQVVAARMWSDLAPAMHELQLVRRDGELVDVELSVTAFKEGGEHVGVLAEARDLTETRRAAETIRKMADYDALTGLPNRDLFDRYLNQALAEARPQGRNVAVLMIGLDRFKLVNDTLGYPNGDRLLQGVARRFTGQLPPGNTVARFGGDEFLVLIPDLQRVATAQATASDLIHVLREPFYQGSHEVQIVASIGMSIFPAQSDTAEELVRQASAAMVAAKSSGGNSVHEYAPDDGESAESRLALEVDLRRAVDREEFLLHYQPLVSMASGEIVGVEALLRWRHPDRGLVQPIEFIPLLEETGEIVRVGEWVIRRACAEVQAWRNAGLPEVRVAVNLSARQLLDPNLHAVVWDALSGTGLPPGDLEFEVTETAATLNQEAAIRALERLRDIGVRAAIDDFGTGHSSLGRLKDFPIDTLKIDRSFVSALREDESGLAIIKGVIALGHALDLTIVAEGIETELQAHILRGLDCDLAQGFLYAKPGDEATLRDLLASGIDVARADAA